MWGELFHSFTLLDVQNFVTSCLGMWLCNIIGRAFSIHGEGYVSNIDSFPHSGPTELGMKWGGVGWARMGEVEWRGLGLKCTSPHIRNPHIRDLMGSFSSSMQYVGNMYCILDIYGGGKEFGKYFILAQIQ